MKVSLMIEGQEGVTWPQWLTLAAAAEAAQLDGFFRSDHYRSIVRGEPAGSLDAWATLAAIAARTERLRLGTMVSPVTFRHPAVLAKTAATVDQISGGRVELGIGAGWYEAEHSTYGFPFGSVRERFDELDHQLGEITRQWAAADVQPHPIQHPRPPIIVGGRGGRRSIAAAVRYADEYNSFAPTVAEAHERIARLADVARAAGRETLRFSIAIGCVVGLNRRAVEARVAARRSVNARQTESEALSGTIHEVADQLRAYASVGVSRAFLQHLVHEDVDMVADLGELAAELLPQRPTTED